MNRFSLLFYWKFLILFLSSTVLSRNGRPDPALPSNFTQPTPRIYSQAELDQVAAALIEAEAKLISTVTPLNSTPSNVSIEVSLNKNANVSQATLAAAQALVSTQQASDAKYRKNRLDNPIRNVYIMKNSANGRFSAAASIAPISSDVVAAAALLAEVDAAAKYRNGTLYKDYASYGNISKFNKSLEHSSDYRTLSKRQSTTFWMEEMQHLGTQPLGGDSTYKVWRNVKDYGAVGNGVSDDTAAINAAITDGNRCGQGCDSSSVKGALVYFPAGTYLISSTIISYYNTQLVGNALSLPTIKAAPYFVGFALIQSDVYLPSGNSAEWYLDTANFYRQIRNFYIDLSGVTAANAIGIHWQVAQATSLQNLIILASEGTGSTQVSIFAENGSGGFMSDLVIYGGLYGLRGNQQFTTRNLWFLSIQTAIQLNWDWGWTWKSLLIENCVVGINVRSSQANPPGSIYILDSTFNSVTTAILSSPFLSQEQGTTVMVLDNNAYQSVGEILAFSDGTNAGIPTSGYPKFWGHGNVDYAEATAYGQSGYQVSANRPVSLVAPSSSLPQGNIYFERSKPQYAKLPASNFVNIKLLAKGDGVTDDTASINFVLALAASKNTDSSPNLVVFFPAGTYIVTSTINIPANSYIVGECWSQIMASGVAFQNQTSPLVMVQVGSPGDPPASVEISDMLFTARGPTAGLIAIQWNSEPYQQGSVGMWDSHFRIGGAIGTELQVANCPTLTGSINRNCIAANAMLWVTKLASGYFENVWAWIADHDLDDPQNLQVDVYGGRGILIESAQGPNWLYGTASEHAVLYQYELYMTSNTFLGMIQTETPYYQGTLGTVTPSPFTLGILPGDITHDGCDADATSAPCSNAYAVKIINTDGVIVAGAGLYSWFIGHDQDCVDHQDCQQQMFYTFGNNLLQVYNLITIGAVEMVSPFGTSALPTIIAALNMDATGPPWWSVIGAYLNEYISHPYVPFSAITTGWVAFGDSYASGPGAGSLWDDSVRGCWRYTGAYPLVLNQQFQRLSLNDLEMQFLACSGATTQNSKWETQLENWDPSKSDLGTLHIGGSDAKFGDVLVQCILQPWFQGGGKVPGITFDCPGAINDSATIIGSAELENNLIGVYNAIFDKASTSFSLYVGGYPEFFDIPGVADNCGTLGIGFPPYPQLTTDLRTDLSVLTKNLNTVIQTAVQKVGESRSILFVPFPASAFDGHRFCTAGYGVEPIEDKDEDAHIYFFRWFGKDNYPGEENAWPPSGLPEPPPPLIAPPSNGVSSETINPTTCNSTLDEPYDFEEVWCSWAQEAAVNSTFAAELSTLDNESSSDALMNLTVTWKNGVILLGSDGGAPLVGSTETFHPKSLGHVLIADAFYEAIVFGPDSST